MRKPFAFAAAALAAFSFSLHAQEAAPAPDEAAPDDPAATADDAAPAGLPEAGETAAAELTPAETQELAPEEGDWSGQISAGFLATDGNAQSRSINGKLLAEYKKEKWKNAFNASAVNTSGSTGTTAERYMASDKVDYLFYEKNYAFLVGEYEKDLFGGTRQRTSEAIGVGRHFLTGPAHILDLEIGGGARQTEANVTGDYRNEAIARAAGKYEWKFTEKNSFLQTVKSESGSQNTFTESVTQLKLAIIGDLSSSLSYTVRHNTDVPLGREHVDTEAAINVVYDIGRD